MKCALCKEEVNNYDDRLNRFETSKGRSAYICHDCINDFTKWQGAIIGKLFPTSEAKRRLKKRS